MTAASAAAAAVRTTARRTPFPAAGDGACLAGRESRGELIPTDRESLRMDPMMIMTRTMATTRTGSGEEI